MQFLLDLGFWHSVEETWTRTSPSQNRFICIPKKIEKITHFDGGNLDHNFHSNMFEFDLHLFQFIFASFFSGQAKLGFR